MSVKPELNLKSIVGPKTKVIVWVSEKPLTPNDDIFHDLNYLFDGLISKDIKKIDPNSSSLYNTFGFGNELFLFRLKPNHIDINKEEIEKKAQMGVASHNLLLIDADLEESFYKISRSFETLTNLEIHLTKDLIKSF